MIRAAFLAFACGTLFFAGSAYGETQDVKSMSLAAKDARVASIGFKLATGNAPFCDRITPATGLLLDDVTAYTAPDTVRAAMGLSGDFSVRAVVPGSPAAKAGLTADQELIRIGGKALGTWAKDPKEPGVRLEQVRAMIGETLAAKGAISFTPKDGSAVEITGIPACHSRFEVAKRKGKKRKGAAADGDRVIVGDWFPGHAWPDDLLAGLIAHELAHNVLSHRAILDANGRKRTLVRLTEREADRLAPWLLANAGFAPDAAPRFMQAWGPKHSGGWLTRKRTHDGWDERMANMQAEVKLVEAKMAATGQADWRTHFVREDLPGV